MGRSESEYYFEDENDSAAANKGLVGDCWSNEGEGRLKAFRSKQPLWNMAEGHLSEFRSAHPFNSIDDKGGKIERFTDKRQPAVVPPSHEKGKPPDRLWAHSSNRFQSKYNKNSFNDFGAAVISPNFALCNSRNEKDSAKIDTAGEAAAFHFDFTNKVTISSLTHSKRNTCSSKDSRYKNAEAQSFNGNILLLSRLSNHAKNSYYSSFFFR